MLLPLKPGDQRNVSRQRLWNCIQSSRYDKWLSKGNERQSNHPTVISTFRKMKQGEDTLSPEDAAWVDSCFTSNFEYTEDGLAALKAALQYFLDSSPSTENQDSLSIDNGDRLSIDRAPKPVPFNEFLENDGFSETAPWSKVVPVDEGLGYGRSSPLDLGNNDTFEAGIVIKPIDEFDSLENIFKVWDLETQFEEDEFVKKLNDALTESSPSVPFPSLSDAVAPSSSQDLENIIAGLADLSLLPWTD